MNTALVTCVSMGRRGDKRSTIGTRLGDASVNAMRTLPGGKDRAPAAAHRLVKPANKSKSAPK